MKRVNGFKSEAPMSAYPMLPAGAYVAVIKNVKVDGDEPDQQLVLRLEIIEGEWAGYYTKRYEHDTQNASGGGYKVKYKGDYRIQIPDERNTKRIHPEWDLRTLNNSIWCIEASNPGFHWDGEHEMDLKGKIVGINVRGGVYNMNPYTAIGRLEAADDVRNGVVKPMKPREDTANRPGGGQDGFTMVENEELPF